MKLRFVMIMVVFIVGWILLSSSKIKDPIDGIQLVAPQFVETAYAQDDGFNFLMQEAGMTAYANIEQPIDLSSVRRFFTTIDEETSTYIIGSVTAPGYENIIELEERMNLHVFVHVDGWVVSYLLQRQSAGLLIDWAGYDGDKLNSTTIADIVQKVLGGTTGAGTPVTYYDFRYPQATTIEMIADVETDSKQVDGFELEIPPTFTVFESAWSHGTFNTDYSTCNLNGEDYSVFESSRDRWKVQVDNFAQSRLTSGNVDSFWFYNDDAGSSGRTYCGLVLIYRKPQ